MRTIGRRSFDHVVVGAGAAGCALAARLAEDRRRSVLLVERGPRSRSIWTDMPAGIAFALASGRYSTVLAAKGVEGAEASRFAQIQGRAVGGSSLINGMMYVRGHRDDYDGWAAAGGAGWSFEDVLPYFIRAERHLSRRDLFHGVDGPLAVSSPRLERLSEIHRAFLAAGATMGAGVTDDFNGARQEGFGLFDRTVGGGMRSDAARSYLRTAGPNLVVLDGSAVARIRIDEGRAVGIVLADGSMVDGREIVLSAGAYVSPQLLMLSGIGPGDELRALGIEVVRDRPGIGRNLQNHPDLALQYRLKRPSSLHALTRFPGKQMAGLQWLLARRGPAASNHFEAGAFLRSGAERTRPDLQLTLFGMALRPGTTEPLDEPGIQVHLTLVQPASRGRVSLRSRDPSALPAIDLGYLADPSDRIALRRGIGLVRATMAAPAMAALCDGEIAPGTRTNDAEPLDRWIDSALSTFYHPCGTCRMGAASDPMAVVGPDLKLHGIEGLRVVDASVMPSIPAGNTYAPTLMVAEKAADLIRATS